MDPATGNYLRYVYSAGNYRVFSPNGRIWTYPNRVQQFGKDLEWLALGGLAVLGISILANHGKQRTNANG